MALTVQPPLTPAPQSAPPVSGAQTVSPETVAKPADLPALKVEAAKPKPKVVRKATPRRPSASAQRAPTAQVSAPAQQEPATGPVAPGANPYADPAAPFKVDRSANSKLTEPLLDMPRTVTTISKEVLQDKQATSLRELARTTPGITLGTGEGGNSFGDVIFIRGFRASNDAYIDGVRDSSVTIRENFMTEQVEVLKGPSSVIGGRGTTGGAVNLVTKKPQETDFGVVTTTLGTDQTRRMTADVNQSAGKFAVRANGMWQEANVAGRDEVFDDRWGGAIAGTWTPTDYFKLTLDYYHLEMDGIPDWGVPWDAVNKRPFMESGVPRSRFYGVTGRDFLDGGQDIATATAELKIAAGIVVTNKLRQGRSLMSYVASAPERPVTTDVDPSRWTLTSAAKSRHQVNDILANQTDVKAEFKTGHVKHTLVTGVELSKEEISRDTFRALDTESFTTGGIAGCSVDLFTPVTSACWDPSHRVTRAGNPTFVDVESKSAYVLDTMKFTPQWIFTAGMRVDDYDIALTSRNATTGAVTSLARHDTMFNWNAGLTWKPRENGSVYFAYGTSTNPVGQELDAGGDDYGGFTARSQILEPERNIAMEFGTKWELLHRRMLVSAALFQTTKLNARETVGAGPASTLQDTGEYQVRGIELGVAGNVTRDLSVHGGAVFMDSEVTKSAVDTNVGVDFANIAHTTFNMMAKYRLTERLTVGGQATYAGEIQGGTFAATNGNKLPDHWRFDLLAELKITKNMDLQLNVLNLTDEVYYDAFYRSSVPYVYIAPGRAAYLTARFKY